MPRKNPSFLQNCQLLIGWMRVRPHQRCTLSLAVALDRHISKVDTSNTSIFSSISIAFLFVLSMDSQEYQVEMEQWKEDLRAAWNQVSLAVLSSSHFEIVFICPWIIFTDNSSILYCRVLTLKEKTLEKLYKIFCLGNSMLRWKKKWWLWVQ